MAAPDTALVSRSPGQTWVALLAEGAVWEVHVFPDHRPRPGDVWLGRLRGRVPGTDAAFVDLGTGRDGFLPTEDMPGGLPPEGAIVLVQVAQAARPDKGPKLTGNVSLAAPTLAYTPLRPGVSLSGRLRHKSERARLQAWAERAAGDDEGVVVRTAAFGCPEPDLNRTLADLRAAWKMLETARREARAPARLRTGEPPLAAALAGRAVERVLCEGPGAAEQARRARPDLADRIKACTGTGLLDEEGVPEAVESALARRLSLPGGGAVSIETTAAATAIDVDSGAADENAANQTALAVIARQIRLRALAGAIVIDFAAPRHGAAGARKKLAGALARALADDPAQSQVLGVSALGLVEVRRPRLRPPLADLLLDAAPTPAPAPEAVALEALRQVVRSAQAVPSSRPRLAVAAPVAALLKGPLAGAVAEAERILGHALTINARPEAPVDTIDVRT